MSSPMTDYSFRNLIKIMDKRGYFCAICGYRFPSLACVTIEHIVPASLGGSRRGKYNQGVSHFNCNNLRGSRPLEIVREEIENMKNKMSPADFWSWLGKKIPGRTVFIFALNPPEKIKEMLEKDQIQ